MYKYTQHMQQICNCITTYFNNWNDVSIVLFWRLDIEVKNGRYNHCLSPATKSRKRVCKCIFWFSLDVLISSCASNFVFENYILRITMSSPYLFFYLTLPLTKKLFPLIKVMESGMITSISHTSICNSSCEIFFQANQNISEIEEVWRIITLS